MSKSGLQKINIFLLWIC